MLFDRIQYHFPPKALSNEPASPDPPPLIMIKANDVLITMINVGCFYIKFICFLTCFLIPLPGQQVTLLDLHEDDRDLEDALWRIELCFYCPNQ